MWKNIFTSFALAINTIRSHFFHTVLSVLGIVIGVAALVTILSLIDGMEQYANEQISSTTSLKAIMVQTETYKNLDGVRLKKEKYKYLTYHQFLQLKAALSYPATGYLATRQSGEIKVHDQDKSFGVVVHGAALPLMSEIKIAKGALFTEADLENKAAVAVINSVLARQIVGEKGRQEFVLGQRLFFKGKELKIIGIMAENEDHDKNSGVIIPITFFSDDELKENPPFSVIEAGSVEDVQKLKAEIEYWLTNNIKGDPTDFKVSTNEYRVNQVAKGFLFFRLVMGFIVGISVIVGGIGVMNVLIISVTERTAEIGVRKAVGAKRRDIMLQFLSESVTISTFGSLLGLLIGILFTLVLTPVIKTVADVPFEAVFTLDTMIIIGFTAILIGIVFGTYPALRAARLDPVEAIRRE